jgi:hypothetical protein
VARYGWLPPDGHGALREPGLVEWQLELEPEPETLFQLGSWRVIRNLAVVSWVVSWVPLGPDLPRVPWGSGDYWAVGKCDSVRKMTQYTARALHMFNWG